MPGFRWFLSSPVRFFAFAVLALFPCSAVDELHAAPGDILHTFTAPADQIGYTYGASFGMLGDNIYVSGERPNLTFVANIYDRQSYTPVRTISLPPPAGATSSNYDWRDVAAHGDRLLVSGIQSGAYGRVSLVNGTTGGLIRTYRHPALSTQDGFGLSVAFAGDDILVSDYLAPDRSQTGAVYLYDGDSPNLLRTFINPTGVPNDQFGATMAAIGDKILIGAPHYERPDDRQSGAVYLFNRNTGELLNTIYGTGTSNIERFGHSISVEGNRVLIGGERTGPQAIYDARNLSLIQHIPDSSPYPPDYFTAGTFVDHAVALTRRDGDTDRRHVVKLFDGNSGDLIADLYSPGPSSIEYFGPAAAAGNEVLIRYRTQDSVLLYEGAHAPGASLLTIPTAQLLRFAPRFESPEGPVTAAIFQAQAVGNGVEYQVSLGDAVGPQFLAEVAIGVPAADVGLAHFDEFDGLSFRVTNTDNSQWDVAVFLRETDGTLHRSEYTTLNLLGTAYVTLEFDALSGGATDLAAIADVGLLIRGQLDAAAPHPSNGDIAHLFVEPVSTATAVPEPAAIYLAFLALFHSFAARYRTTRCNVHASSNSQSPSLCD
jgi:hypothetical protein